MNEKKFAIFDFCHTLIYAQTADLFVNFAKPPQSISKKLFLSLIFILNKLRMIKGETKKRYILSQLKGMSLRNLETKAKEFQEQILEPLINTKILEILQEHKKDNTEIIIVSGGYLLYQKEFAKRYNIKKVIATKIKFTNNICDGEINGENCMGENKITLLKKELDINNYNLEKSYVYTDDLSDTPLLNLVGNSYVIDFGQKLNPIAKNKYNIIKL